MATTNGNYQIVLSTRLDTNKIAQDLKKLEKISITVKISDDTIKRVRELNQLLRDTKALQNFTQGMSNVSKSMENYEKIASKVVAATANMAKSAEQVGDSSQKAAKHVKTFGERAADAFQKFSLWSVVSNIFFQIVNSAKQLVDTAIELDRSFTELTKVTNLTRDNFDELTERAYNLGQGLAKTTKEVVDAMTEFAKAGYSVEESTDILAKNALMWTNIADGTVSASDSANMLISVMKAFKMEAQDTTHIIDALNEVSNNYAISSGQLSDSLSKSASVLANAGVKYEEMLGLITGITEITRNANKASTALRTISLRLQGMEEDGEAVDGLTAKLEGDFQKLGLTLYDTNGNLKDTYEILKDLSVAYQNMDTAQKAYYTELVAGKTRATEAAAILSNFDRIMAATETAYNSNGSAARENQKVLESLNGSIQKLKAEWESLANSKATQDTLQFFVDLTTNIIKLLKQIGGLRTAFIALAAVMAIRNASKIIDTFTKLYNIISMIATKGLPKYIAQLHIATAAETAEATAATAATAATMAFQVALGVIAVAAIALIAIIENLSSEYEKNAEAVNKAKEEYQAIVSDQQAVQDKIKDIEEQIIELNKNPIDITKQKTIDDLNEQKQLLQDQLDILDMLEKYEKSEVYQATYEKLTGMGGVSNKELIEAGVNLNSYSSASRISAYGKNYSTVGQKNGLGYHELNPVQRLEVLGDAIQDYTNKIKELEEAQGHLTGSEDEIEKQYNKNKELIEEYSNNTLPKLKGMYATLAEELEEDKDNLDENNVAHKSLIDTIVNVITGQRDFEQANKDSTESVKDNTEAIEENANSLNTLDSTLESVYNLVEEADKKYKDLSAAVEEYNDQGKLSISTLAKMMKDYPEYLDALNKEGWSIETVNNMLSANIKIKLEEAKIAAQAAKERIQNAKTHLEEAKAALLNAQANDTLANSHAKIARAAHDAQNEERNATQEYYEQMRKIAELEAALAGGFGGYTKSKSTGSSSSSSKKETDKWKEAFEKAYNDLKHRRNIDLIDTEQYIKELTELNDQYFKDRVEYETEYNKYVEELYKERQNLFKEQINDLKFALEMLENQGANKQTLIAKYKEIQEKLHEQAQYYRSLEIEENNDLIQNLQSQWWDYQKKIKSLEEDIVDEIEKQNKEIKEQLEKEIELLDERFEALRDYAKDAIDAEIELKEKSLEAQNALLDEQINKYKEEKENLDDQKGIADKLLKIEEARKKLAESKNQKVRVYREGKGFVYESDFDAVAQAQNQLDELLKDWDLFQEKAKIADIIAELEAEKEANEKRVNAEIEDLNRLKEVWDKSLDLSKDVEDYKGWLTKIKNSESASFNERLSLVKSFVASYNREMASLQTKYPTSDEVNQIVSKDSNKVAITNMKSYGGVLYSEDVDYQALINNTLANAPETEKASMLKNYETKRNAKIAGEGLSEQQTSLYGGTTFSATASKSSSSGGGSSSRSGSSSSGSKSSSSSSSSTTMSKNDQTKIAIAKEAYNIAASKGDTAGMAAAHAAAEKVRASYGYSGGADGSQHVGLANGTYSADGMMHLVGEEGPELFIPPEGSGIIPNPKTTNLMQWGNINPAQLLSNMGGNTTIEVGNITLPNVTNAKSFVEELKNFRTYAVQKQSVRK